MPGKTRFSVLELALQAGELPPEQRGAFIARSCGTNDKLRGSVEQLVRAMEDLNGADLEAQALLPEERRGLLVTRHRLEPKAEQTTEAVESSVRTARVTEAPSRSRVPLALVAVVQLIALAVVTWLLIQERGTARVDRGNAAAERSRLEGELRAQKQGRAEAEQSLALARSQNDAARAEVMRQQQTMPLVRASLDRFVESGDAQMRARALRARADGYARLGRWEEATRDLVAAYDLEHRSGR